MLALIMAGGSGTRFWPKSRQRHPKQLLHIHGDETMIQQTVRRLQTLIPNDNIYIISTQLQMDEIRLQLPEIPAKNLIIEPVGKNTAPCIGLGALIMRRLDPEAVMVVLPADHLIGPSEIWQRQLLEAERIAKSTEALVTIGISPTYPATGYGYIQHTGQRLDFDGVDAFQVKTFAEKPNLETAKRFLTSGEFLWNSGIFIWKVSTILSEIETHLPELADVLYKLDEYIGTPQATEAIDRAYRQIRGISIDYAVMEHANNVIVLKGEFEWNDLGSWNEVYQISKKDELGNVADGRHILLGSEGCLVDVESRMVAGLGLKDLIIVETDDALLICPRSRAQDVKEVVEALKRRKNEDLI